MNTAQPKFWRSRAYVRRWRTIEPAPEEFTAYISAFNQEAGKPTNARPSTASPEFLLDLRNALGEMPQPVLSLLGDKFLGVYLARDLGCSAVVDVVRHEGCVIGTAIALDVDAFEHRSANQWATWNENLTCHVAEPEALTVKLGECNESGRQVALQFLLLHEIGHVLVAGRRFLPEWWIRPDTLGPAGSYRFLSLSWTIDESMQIVPRQADDRILRDQISRGAGSITPVGDALRIYADLQATSFPTPYALTNAYEDFAECLAIYVHTRLMRRPYRVELRGAGVHVVGDGPSIAARCSRKFEFVEALLGLSLPAVTTEDSHSPALPAAVPE